MTAPRNRSARRPSRAALISDITDLRSYTGAISHDLRAPLRHISGFTALLQSHLGESADTTTRHYLDRIAVAATQMRVMADSLLAMTRLGSQTPTMRHNDIRSIVDEIIAGLRFEYVGRDVEWRVGPLPTLSCDRDLIKVVLTNLMSNAVKYTRPRLHAVIDIGMTGGRRVFVTDNGVGFDMEHADKLFGVFQRLHSASEFEGAGVGLATAQRIILKHDGDISGTGTIDGGASFSFDIGPGIALVANQLALARTQALEAAPCAHPAPMPGMSSPS